MTTALSKQDKSAVVKAQSRSPLITLGARFDVEPGKLVEVLRGTVIKPDRHGKHASNEEVAAFCIVANQYGLNPFTREIHAFTSGEKGVVPIVGIDGWCKIVNTHPGYDGCDFDEIADDNGAPVAVTCRTYVKGRDHAVSVTERFAECKRDTIPWRQFPWRMLRHKAFMQAARYAFGLAGIYDEDEARDITRNAPIEREPIMMPVAAEPEPITATASSRTDDGEPGTLHESFALAEGESEIRGVLEDLTSKAISGGKTKWDATIDGTRYGFFSATLAREIEPATGEKVIAIVKQSGKYWNLVDCRPDMDTPATPEQTDEHGGTDRPF